jgi:ABC-type sugar transport system ATPase subunit
MNQSQVLLATQGVAKAYGPVVALRGVDMTVRFMLSSAPMAQAKARS